MKNTLMIVIVSVVLAGGLGFWGGTVYNQQRLRQAFTSQMGRGGRPLQGRFNTSGNSIVRGEILSQDDKGITVKLRDGSSKIVFISDTTQITKADQGAKVDLVKGKQVMVIGKENSDGTVSAQSVQMD